ncbi:MAG TPA: hypothetical protein PLG90_11540 [Ignavibacteria bacterium]|nr:hypothetical protein [Ignavibacteria bacterium]
MPFEITWSQALMGGLLGLIASFFISTKAIPSLILRIIVYMVAGIFGSYLAGKYLPVADSSFLQFLFNLLGTSVVLLIVAAFFRVLRGK